MQRRELEKKLYKGLDIGHVECCSNCGTTEQEGWSHDYCPGCKRGNAPFCKETQSICKGLFGI